jgi:tetratricopeptide (TPR) repeat protein
VVRAPKPDDGDQIVVTGGRIARPQLESAAPATTMSADAAAAGAQSARQRGGGSGARIALPAWSPDRPYLAALNAAAPADLDRVLAEQQARHGALPAFWLDVAEWHFRKGRRAVAVSTLLSALELPTRNSQTLSIVAERLMRYGEIDRAIFLLERLVAAEPDRPQPRRTLALALAKRAETGDPARRRADLGRAIALLTEVVMTPWADAYDGIEMISLMEVNALIPRYRALGGSDVALDRRLIALLDTDLRVVVEWNSEATDIDLWVDEPNGERAIFNNPRTTIGGRLSNDMTAGYGPEEYLLRRAPNGTFTARAHVYAADRINPNGASVLTARLIRDFGRPTQSEEVVDIELLPDSGGRERLIGRIVFRR